MSCAIEDAMRKFPDADDAYILCDGDVSPFSGTSWGTFRSRFPKVKFHFIALGSDSSMQEMQQMASVGGGSYTENT